MYLSKIITKRVAVVVNIPTRKVLGKRRPPPRLYRVTDPTQNSRRYSVSRNEIICSLARVVLKFHPNPCRTFRVVLLTNAGDNVTSLAEVAYSETFACSVTAPSIGE